MEKSREKQGRGKSGKGRRGKGKVDEKEGGERDRKWERGEGEERWRHVGSNFGTNRRLGCYPS